jgi:membrane protease subunit HflC
MRWKLIIALVLLAVGAAVVARLSVYTVDRTEFVYLTQFGRHVATYDGADDDQAGLHVRWPWPVESAQGVDRRLQYFDLPGTELLTRDVKRNTIDKTLTVDAYVCWRVADAQSVDRFIRTVGTVDGANAVLRQRVGSELGAAVGKLELDDLINVNGDLVGQKRDELRTRLLDGGARLRQTAREEYGIEIVDIRLRRTNHPPAVREAIFDRIKSEREKKSADYRSEGDRRALDVKSASDRKVSESRTEAEAEALRLRGLAEAEADRIRSDAQRLDPQFYAFLKKLDDYQRILGDNKTLLLLSTHRELFDALFQPPGSNGPPLTPNPSPPRGEGRDEKTPLPWGERGRGEGAAPPMKGGDK